MEKIVFLVGFMGSGKSYWGKKISTQAGWPFVDMDAWIENRYQTTISAVFEQYGEAQFREMERDYLHEIGQRNGPLIVSTGGGTPCFFDNMAWMNAHGITIWLDKPMEIMLQWLWQERAHRPLLANVPEDTFKETVISRLNVRKPFYEQAQFRVEDGSDIFNLLR